jgi:threonyl-tRNA synthetase
MVFWHPKGWALWQQVEQYMRRVYRDNGYQEIRCPQILDARSGSAAATGRTTRTTCSRRSRRSTTSRQADELSRPRPGVQQGLRSYRDLPLRYGEFGACHRNEPSGALHGIMRVRGFTQDDGHIFCTPEQIEPECVDFHSSLQGLRDFGFTRHRGEARAAARKRIGEDAQWDGRGALRDACAPAAPVGELAGEGAFYGPKIEYHLKDSIGRSWQWARCRSTS